MLGTPDPQRQQSDHKAAQTRCEQASATTSLTPYGASFWALILAACGGGGGGVSTSGSAGSGGSGGGQVFSSHSDMVQLSGYAYNRPLKDGEVWLDVNGNQKIDAGDYRVPDTINEKGQYRGEVPAEYANRPLMVNTTTTEYQGRLPDVLLAPAGSKVVSPFTHGLVTGAIQKADLPKGFDPLSDNPYDDSNPENARLFEQIRDVLPQVSLRLSRNSDAIANNQQAIQQLRQELLQLQKEIAALSNPQLPPQTIGKLADVLDTAVLSITQPPLQPQFNETTEDAATQRFDTGIIIQTGKQDKDARLLVIESMQGGRWQVDARFETDNGRLFIKSGQQLNFEDADNPGGLIKLRVTTSDAAGNIHQKTTSFQLTNVNEPTVVESTSIEGLVAGSAPVGTLLKARVSAEDPDTSALTISYGWFHQDEKETLSDAASFTPEKPGRYTLSILIEDDEFGQITLVIKEFTVPQPAEPTQPPSPFQGPATGRSAQFFSTETGRFSEHSYEFLLAEDAQSYEVMGTVNFSNHADPSQAGGRSLYTLSGPDSSALRLSSDGLLRLGKDVRLDAEGVGGLAELQFIVAAVYFPEVGSGQKMSYSRSAVSRVKIYDPSNPPDKDAGPKDAGPKDVGPLAPESETISTKSDIDPAQATTDAYPTDLEGLHPIIHSLDAGLSSAYLSTDIL